MRSQYFPVHFIYLPFVMRGSILIGAVGLFFTRLYILNVRGLKVATPIYMYEYYSGRM